MLNNNFCRTLRSTAFRLIRPLYYHVGVEKCLKQVSKDPIMAAKQYHADLIDFVSLNNNYYQKLSKDNMGDFPLLNKAIINKNFNEIRSENINRHPFKNSSGGSTGVPQTFIQDRHYSGWLEISSEFYFRQFHKINYTKVKKIVLWGSERDIFKQTDLVGKIYNWLSNTVFLNTFKLSEEGWLNHIHQINRYQPYFIKGYAGSLYQIALIAKKHNLKVYQPKFIYSAAEMLQEFMREEIESVFHCKVYDFYGSREVGPIAGECAEGNKHIFLFNNWVEITNGKGDRQPDGTVGNIVITNLHNYSMPLIRYEIGDMGIINSTPCPCGSPLPYFTKIVGRITDHFRLKDGTMVHGEYFTHLFYHQNWVHQFQVNQRDYNLIEILIIKNGQEDKTAMADIENKIRIVMGNKCCVKWHFPDHIPTTAQGKHLFTRCMIGK